MGIDWGIALGAGAQSAVKTYDNLTNIERQELLLKKEKQEQEQEQAFQNSIKQQYTVKNPEGGIASGQAFDQGIKYETPDVQEAVKGQVSSLTPEQQQEVFRKLKGTSVDVRGQAIPAAPEATAEMGAVQGGAPTAKPGLDLGQVQVYKGKGGETLATTEGKARAPEQIMRGVMDDMYKSGNMVGYQKATAVYKMAREVSMSDATDKIMEDARSKTEQFQDTLDKHGMVGAVEKLGSEFAKSGIKLSVVKGKDGKDSVAVLGSDGKPQQTFTNSAQVMDAFSDLMGKHTMNQLMKVPGANPKDLMSMMKDKAQGNYYDKRAMFDEIMMPYQIQEAQARIAHHQASAKAAGEKPDNSVKGKVTEYATALVDAGTINPKTEKPYTQAEAKAYATSIVLRDPNAKPERVNQLMENAKDYAEVLFNSEAINPTTKKPFASLEEAQKYAMGVALKDPSQASSAKQLTEVEKIAYPKFLEAVQQLKDPTVAQQLALAKRFNIRPEVLNLPAQPQTQETLNNLKPGVLESIFGKSGTPEANNPAAPKTAIPQPNSDVALREVQRQLDAHVAQGPGKQQRGGARNSMDPEVRLKWETEKTRLENLLDSLKPGGANFRK
jgi:hypothetical protein